MSKRDKKRFIRELIKTIEQKLISKVDKMPKEWDGFELRWLIGEAFNQFSTGNDERRRNFDNEVLVNNLL